MTILDNTTNHSDCGQAVRHMREKQERALELTFNQLNYNSSLFHNISRKTNGRPYSLPWG